IRSFAPVRTVPTRSSAISSRRPAYTLAYSRPTVHGRRPTAARRSDAPAPSGGLAPSRTAQHGNLGLELVRTTEAAALSAGRWMGNLDREGIRTTAAGAMREALLGVHMNGTIVVGDEPASTSLGVGQPAGDGGGEACDVALKAIDGSSLV